MCNNDQVKSKKRRKSRRETQHEDRRRSEEFLHKLREILHGRKKRPPKS